MVKDTTLWYDSHQHKRSNRAFVQELVRRYNLKGKRLLDVGCGVGYFSNEFSKAGVNVTACDLREPAINKGKEMFGNNITWICGDATQLKLKEKPDAVFASGFQLYLTKDVIKYLKDGGVFIFTCASNLKGPENRSSNLSLEHVVNHLKVFGTIIDAYTTNLQAFPVLGRLALNRFFTILTTLLLRLHKRNVWLVVSIRKEN